MPHVKLFYWSAPHTICISLAWTWPSSLNFRWHKEIEFESKIIYAKHRVAEACLWAVGTYFEPEYSQGRVLLANVVILLTALDDTYDAYGTKEELDLFTYALEKYSFSMFFFFLYLSMAGLLHDLLMQVASRST